MIANMLKTPNDGKALDEDRVVVPVELREPEMKERARLTDK